MPAIANYNHTINNTMPGVLSGTSLYGQAAANKIPGCNKSLERIGFLNEEWRHLYT